MQPNGSARGNDYFWKNDIGIPFGGPGEYDTDDGIVVIRKDGKGLDGSKKEKDKKKKVRIGGFGPHESVALYGTGGMFLGQFFRR